MIYTIDNTGFMFFLFVFMDTDFCRLHKCKHKCTTVTGKKT